MKKEIHQRLDKNRKRPICETAPGEGEPEKKGENSTFSGTGTLYVVATPIGNLEDITIRAIRILKEVKMIAAEDTRRTKILLDALQVSTPLTSLYDQNELKKSGMLLAKLLKGEDVAYVSDAGTPGISDPGYVLVREAISRDVRVVPIPGASAFVAALSVSALPMDSFVFLGFLPSKPGLRRRCLTSLCNEERTLIFYESPHRLLSCLHDIQELLGNRPVVVSREMTKIYEEFLRGTVGEVLAALGEKTIKGELTLIVAGRSEEAAAYSDEEILCRHEMLRTEGGGELSLRDAADRLAEETGVSRRRIYQLLLFS